MHHPQMSTDAPPQSVSPLPMRHAPGMIYFTIDSLAYCRIYISGILQFAQGVKFMLNIIIFDTISLIKEI